MNPRFITTSDRPDLEEQGKAALLAGWPGRRGGALAAARDGTGDFA